MADTEVAYVRIFSADKRELAIIAKEEHRSVAQQAALIFRLGIKAYREQHPK